MNKKAVGVLMMVSAAFLIAVILFYHVADKQKPGGKTFYLGENEIRIFNTYIEGEKMLLYIDLAAENSYRKAVKEAEKRKDNQREYDANLLANFTKEFNQYIDEFNRIFGKELSINDYDFAVKENKVIGVCNKELNITNEFIDYRFKPSFKVPLP